MPGTVSLEKHQYYGHPANQFWPIIYGIFGKKPDAAYSRRTRFLRDKGMALWDTLASCRRTGSADQGITDERPVDLPGFLTRHPGIRYIAFDGAQAGRYFARFFGKQRGMVTRVLPSTSPRNTLPWAEKLKEWSVLRCWVSSRSGKKSRVPRRVSSG